MSGCHDCGLPGYSDPATCPVCSSHAPAHEAYLHDFTTGKPLSEKIPHITTRIIPELAYVVLSRVTGEHLSGPIIEPVAFWHKGNTGNAHPDAEYASRVTLNQLRKLSTRDYVDYAIAVVAMPPEEAWKD